MAVFHIFTPFSMKSYIHIIIWVGRHFWGSSSPISHSKQGEFQSYKCYEKSNSRETQWYLGEYFAQVPFISFCLQQAFHFWTNSNDVYFRTLKMFLKMFLVLQSRNIIQVGEGTEQFKYVWDCKDKPKETCLIISMQRGSSGHG